jgi:hypothetical protein
LKKARRAMPAARRRVPVRTFADWNEPPPGSMEMDCVAHCGDANCGSYVNFLNAHGNEPGIGQIIGPSECAVVCTALRTAGVMRGGMGIVRKNFLSRGRRGECRRRAGYFDAADRRAGELAGAGVGPRVGGSGVAGGGGGSRRSDGPLMRMVVQ